MRAKLFALFVCLLFSRVSSGNFSCHLTQQLGNPKVASDAKFWEEFGRLSDRGNDKELAELLKRYDVDARSSSSSAKETAKASQIERRSSAPTAPAFQINHTAQKELRKLQPALRAKASEFLELAKGGRANLYAELRKKQGSWEFEKLNAKEGHSVRINGGYRIQFTEGPNDSIEITHFSKTSTHGGH